MVVPTTYTVKVIDEEGIFGPGILGGLSSSRFLLHALCTRSKVTSCTVVIHQRHDVKK